MATALMPRHPTRLRGTDRPPRRPCRLQRIEEHRLRRRRREGRQQARQGAGAGRKGAHRSRVREIAGSIAAVVHRVATSPRESSHAKEEEMAGESAASGAIANFPSSSPYLCAFASWRLCVQYPCPKTLSDPWASLLLFQRGLLRRLPLRHPQLLELRRHVGRMAGRLHRLVDEENLAVRADVKRPTLRHRTHRAGDSVGPRRPCPWGR